MEQSPLLPLSTKISALPSMRNKPLASSVIHDAEDSGRKYAEIMMNQIDRWAEQSVGGAQSPLEGFKGFPKHASEPNHVYVGHSGKRVKGNLPTGGSKHKEDDVDVNFHHGSSPVQIDRLQLDREQKYSAWKIW